MKRDFDCIGFEAPDELRPLMQRTLDRLQNLSPDSYITAHITKKEDLYALKISIKFMSGEFSTVSRGGNLKQVLIRGSEAIYQQIYDWRAHRFDEDPVPAPLN